MNKQADLPIQLRAEGGHTTGEITADHIIRIHLFLAQPLKTAQLLAL